MVVTSRYIASLPAGLVFPDEAMKKRYIQGDLFKQFKPKKYKGLKQYGNRIRWQPKWRRKYYNANK